MTKERWKNHHFQHELMLLSFIIEMNRNMTNNSHFLVDCMFSLSTFLKISCIEIEQRKENWNFFSLIEKHYFDKISISIKSLHWTHSTCIDTNQWVWNNFHSSHHHHRSIITRGHQKIEKFCWGFVCVLWLSVNLISWPLLNSCQCMRIVYEHIYGWSKEQTSHHINFVVC